MSDSRNITNQFWLDDKLSEEQKEQRRLKEQIERSKRLKNRNRKSYIASEDSENEIFFNARSENNGDQNRQEIDLPPLMDQSQQIGSSEIGQEYFLPETATQAPIERIELPSTKPKYILKSNDDLTDLEERNIFGEETGSQHGRYDGYRPSMPSLRQSVDEIAKFRAAKQKMIYLPVGSEMNYLGRKMEIDSEKSDKTETKENESIVEIKTIPRENDKEIVPPRVEEKIDQVDSNVRKLESKDRKRFLNVASEDEKSEEISVILRQQAEVNHYKAAIAEEKKKNEKLRLEYKKEMRKQRLEHKRKQSKLQEARKIINQYKSDRDALSDTSQKEIATEVTTEWSDVTVTSDAESIKSSSGFDTRKTRAKVIGSSPIIPSPVLRNRPEATSFSVPIRRALTARTLNEDNVVVQGQRQRLDDNKKQRYRDTDSSWFPDDDHPITPSRGGGGGGGDGNRNRKNGSNDGDDRGRKGNRGGDGGPSDSPSSSSDSDVSRRSRRSRKSHKKERGQGDGVDKKPMGGNTGIPPGYKMKFPHSFSDGTRDEYEAFKRQFRILSRCLDWNNAIARAELVSALDGKALKRLSILPDEEWENIHSIWKVLDNAFLPAHYHRSILSDFYACKRLPSETMKAYYLNLVDLYSGANQKVNEDTMKEAIRETMLQNLDEEDYEVIRPYLHLDSPEEIANNYDSIITQLKRNNKGMRKDSELEVVNQMGDKRRSNTSESTVQTPAELSTVNVNVVQPSADKERPSRTHLMTKSDNNPPPVIMIPDTSSGMGPSGNQGPSGAAMNNVGGPTPQGAFPNGIVPPPAYVPLNAYSVAPNPIVIQAPEGFYRKEEKDSGKEERDDGNQGNGNNYRKNNKGYRKNNYRNNRNGGNNRYNNDGEDRRDGDRGNYRGDRKVRFNDEDQGGYNNRSGRNRRDNSNIQCYNCKGWGHKAYQCDKPKQSGRDNQEKQEQNDDMRAMIREIGASQREIQKDVDRLYKSNLSLKATGLSQEGTRSQTGILKS